MCVEGLINEDICMPAGSDCSAPEEGHEEAKAYIDHDGHVNVEHVVLCHMRVRGCELGVPAAWPML